MKGDIVAAAEALWGQYTDVYKMEIPVSKTPEDYLLEKDVLRLLSEDAKFLCGLIVSLPNEMYAVNNLEQINWGKLCVVCREKRKWGRTKVKRVLGEIKRKIEKLRSM